MITITLISQLLHFIVLVISHTITKNRKKYAALPFIFYHSNQVVITTDTHIKISIGSKDDTVVASFNEVCRRCSISKLDPCATGGCATRLEIIDRFLDLLFVESAGRGEHQSGVACINYNGDLI